MSNTKLIEIVRLANHNSIYYYYVYIYINPQVTFTHELYISIKYTRLCNVLWIIYMYVLVESTNIM